MAALGELNKSGIVAWCPVREQRMMIALGNVGTDATLDLCTVYPAFCSSTSSNLNPGTLDICSTIKADSRFRCLAWTGGEGGGASSNENSFSSSYPLGIIAGGTDGGGLTLWNPSVILNSKGSENGFISRIGGEESRVRCLSFNPLRMNLVAAGGAGGELQIIDILRTNDAAVYKSGHDETQPASELTCVGWNRRLSYILATASRSGNTVIWDLKQQKPVISFRDSSGRERPSCVCWLPEQPTQILVTYDDDANPTMQLWDLRNANFPLKETNAHTKGIMCADFCDTDPNLMLSCGKDNRTVCWSFASGHPEVYSEMTTQQWNVQVKWSPFLPGVFAAASHMDKIAICNMQQSKHTLPKYVPKWFKRPCGVHCGFGGKMVSFGSTSSSVKCHVVSAEQELMTHADKFEEVLNEGNYVKFCDRKIEASQNNCHDKLTWSLVKLLFQENNRASMVRELGFDGAQISSAVEKYLGYKPGAVPTQNEQNDNCNNDTQNNVVEEVDPEEFFKELGEKTEAEKLEKRSADKGKQRRDPEEVQQAPPKNADWNKDVENLIKKSILIGDLDAAVDMCLKRGRVADALIIASSNHNPQLWINTKQKYLQMQTDNFLKMIGCIVNNDLSELVSLSDLSTWEESLAILCTYAAPDQFKTLCEKLASRLEKEKRDPHAAVVCYLCAGNFSSTSHIWRNIAMHHDGSSLKALQDLVEKTTVLKAATQSRGQEDEGLMRDITKYAEILANSGRLTEAMKFLCLYNDDASLHSAILRDRIYNSSPNNMRASGFSCPPRPFDSAAVPTAENSYSMANTQSNYNKQMQPPGVCNASSGPFYPSAASMARGLPSPHAPQGASPMQRVSTISPSGLYTAAPHPMRPPVPPSGGSSAYVLPNGVGQPGHSNNNFGYADKPPSATTASYPTSVGPTHTLPPTAAASPQHALGSHTPSSSFYTPNAPYMNMNSNKNAHAPAPLPSQSGSTPSMSQFPPTHSSRPPPMPHANGFGYHSGAAVKEGTPPAASPPSGVFNSVPHSSGGGFSFRPPQASATPLNHGSMSPPSGEGGAMGPPQGVQPPPPQLTRIPTAPTVAAAAVKPGMPVPWPIPTPSQLLGSTTTSTAEANQRVHAAAAAPIQGTPMPSSDLQYVMRVLDNLVTLQTQQDAFSKRAEHLKTRIQELYDKLRDGAISKTVGEKVLQLCNAVEREDFFTAQKVHVDLSTTEWDSQNKNWLMSLKRLLTR